MNRLGLLRPRVWRLAHSGRLCMPGFRLLLGSRVSTDDLCVALDDVTRSALSATSRPNVHPAFTGRFIAIPSLMGRGAWRSGTRASRPSRCSGSTACDRCVATILRAHPRRCLLQQWVTHAANGYGTVPDVLFRNFLKDYNVRKQILNQMALLVKAIEQFQETIRIGLAAALACEARSAA